MIKAAALYAILTAIFSDYPVFLNKGAEVEAYTDRGPIVELIVRCPAGTGIISYSKIDKRYCSSKFICSPDIRAAIDNTCG